MGYLELLYQEHMAAKVRLLDTNYSRIAEAARRNFELGETGKLEYLTLKAKKQEIALQLEKIRSDRAAASIRLKTLMKSEESFEIADAEYLPITLEENNDLMGEAGDLFILNHAAATAAARIERYRSFPDIQLEYFLGLNNGTEFNRYNGFQVGLGIPLWFPGRQAAVKSKLLMAEAIQQKSENQMLDLKSRRDQLKLELGVKQSRLEYYSSEGNQLAQEIRSTAQLSYESGGIDLFQYLLALENAVNIELDYLIVLHEYNAIVLEINYLGL